MEEVGGAMVVGTKRKRIVENSRRTRQSTESYGELWRVDSHLSLLNRMAHLIFIYDVNTPIIIHPAITSEENIISFLSGGYESGATVLNLHTSLAVCIGMYQRNQLKILN